MGAVRAGSDRRTVLAQARVDKTLSKEGRNKDEALGSGATLRIVIGRYLTPSCLWAFPIAAAETVESGQSHRHVASDWPPQAFSLGPHKRGRGCRGSRQPE